MSTSGDARQDRNRLLVNLLHACAQQQQPAFQKLYQLTSPQLFAVLVRILKRRDLAEDALQDAFISVWRNAASYTAQKGTPMTWLISICRYRALDMLRRTRLEKIRLDPSEEADENSEFSGLADESQTEEFLSHAEARALKRCLEELSERQRHSLKLAYFDGCSHEEIAGTLRAPLGTVKSWVRRGLQSLKQCLEAA
ncbi:MAG: sigma-70 family RNA polymerase sigma factor [Gammaproteobacteria bacterium]